MKKMLISVGREKGRSAVFKISKEKECVKY